MDKIQVVYEKQKPVAETGTNRIPGNTAGGQWFVNYKSEILSKNTLIAPDGFSSIVFENIGEDPCSIFDSLPVNPESRSREFLNRPGELFSSRIPVMFGNKSENKQLLVIKIYYEKIQ